MNNRFLAQGWLVLVLALVFSGALAAVQVTLHARIEKNKENETYSQIPQLVKVTDPQTGRTWTADAARTIEYQTPDEKAAYKAFTTDGRHIGWVIRSAGQGFADRIEVLIGLDADAQTITGLYVLDQKETPNLGNRITEQAWQAQFAGQSAIWPVRCTKEAPGRGEIQAISGATISSESVCGIVNRAVREFRQRFDELKPKEQ